VDRSARSPTSTSRRQRPTTGSSNNFNDFADAWVFDLVDEPPRIGADGCFAVPDRPGLGLALDHDACAEQPATGGVIKLFEDGWERRERGGAQAGEAMVEAGW
jgi:hypothetical protein